MLISIIVPLHNQAAYIIECLESVAAQTYTNWECIIVNDGSTDNSEDVVNQWITHTAPSSNYQLISIPNSGVSMARNKGISLAKGAFIVALDGDDTLHKNYIAACVAAWKQNTEAQLVYTNIQEFGTRQRIVDCKPFNLKLLAKECPFCCGAMYSKLLWINCGGYDTNLQAGLEDWEFWINTLKNGALVVKATDTYYCYRIKEVSRNLSFNANQRLEIYNYISAKHSQFFAEYLGGSLMYYKMWLDADAKNKMVQRFLPTEILKQLRKWLGN